VFLHFDSDSDHISKWDGNFTLSYITLYPVWNHWHCNWLTPWIRVLEDLIKLPLLVKKFSVISGTCSIMTAFTRSLNYSTSWIRSIYSTPCHSTSLKPILILSHLRHVLPNGLFPSVFSLKTLHAFLVSPTYAKHALLVFLWFLYIFPVWKPLQ